MVALIQRYSAHIVGEKAGFGAFFEGHGGIAGDSMLRILRRHTVCVTAVCP